MRIEAFPADKLAVARKAVLDAYARLEVRARKAGHEPPQVPQIIVERTYTVALCTKCKGDGLAGDACTRPRCGGVMWARDLVDLVVEAAKPKIAGFEFLAVIEPFEQVVEGVGSRPVGGLTSESSRSADGSPEIKGADKASSARLARDPQHRNILRTVPGATIAEGELDEYRVGEHGYCDHCKTTRKRVETFILRADSDVNTHHVIGRNCLQDFLGGKSPAEIMLRYAIEQTIREIGEDGGGGGWEPTVKGAPIEAFLAQTAATVRLDGFVSKKAADETKQSTADFVVYLLTPPGGMGRERWTAQRERCRVTNADQETATHTLAWGRALAERSDYAQNLSLVLSAATVDFQKHAGIAASAISAYERACGKSIEAKRAAAGKAASVHLGKPGDKLSTLLTLERVIDVEGSFGVQHFHSFRDRAGNSVLWRTGSKRLPVGWSGEVSFKVKKHGEFRGELQTEVTHAASPTFPRAAKTADPQMDLGL